MIFNVFLSKLQQKVLGRRESGIVSFVTGFSPRAIKRLERKEDAVATLHKAILERKRSSLMNEGLSWDEATALMAQIPSFTGNTVTPRPLCDLVFLSPGAMQGYYARTLSAAQQLDELSERLAAAREHGSVAAARQVLDDSGFLSPLWFADTNENPDAVPEPAAWRALLAARTWQEMDAPLRTFVGRALLDWLACWDVDFYLSNFVHFTPRSVFALVAPRISSRVRVREVNGQRREDGLVDRAEPEDDPQPGNGRRGLLAKPSNRLLDASAILLARLRLQKWPASTPKLADLASWSGEDAGWLAKVGAGERPLPFSKFEQLWDRASPGADNGGVPAPFPLYVAAQAFELMLVQRRKETRSVVPRSIVTLGEDLYPWDARLAAARASGATIGCEPWPKVLT
jgi:hypothetical protein